MQPDPVERRFIGLPSPTAARNGAGFHPCQGLYHHLRGRQPRVAFIASHYNVDFSEHYLAEHLARHGYGFLGWNTRFRGNEAFFLLEHALIDIGVGVRWLRQQTGVERVILLGNSGGGSLMAAYQSQASDPHIPPSRGMTLPPAVQALLPTDAYVSLNAHRGRPEVLTDWMDPSVTDENDPLATDPSLDMYEPTNGPPYAADFLQRYRAAQVARNHRITAWVEDELQRLQAAGRRDRAFLVTRTWADPRLLDGSLDPSARPIGVCYAGDPRRANHGPMGIGLTNSLRTWLSMWSLEHSPCRGTPHLNRITSPALVIQSDADTGVFPSDAQAIHDALATVDKTLTMVGGDHYLSDSPERRPQVAALIHDWLKQLRFPPH